MSRDVVCSDDQRAQQLGAQLLELDNSIADKENTLGR